MSVSPTVCTAFANGLNRGSSSCCANAGAATAHTKTRMIFFIATSEGRQGIMIAVRRAVLVATLVTIAAHGEEMTLKEAKPLSPERCLQLPPAELATRCPTVAGRILEIDRARVALLDRLDRHQGSFLCDEVAPSNGWRCRRIVVIDRELRGVSKRNPNAFVTAAEVLRQIAAAASVKIGDEFGALSPPGLPPRSCLDLQSHGCAVQAVPLRAFAPHRNC